MDTVRCVRYGYGGYGTVGAVKTGIHPYLPVLNFQKQCFPLLLKFDSAKQKIQVGKIKSQTRAVIPVVDDRGYPHWAPKGVVISNLFKACGAGKKTMNIDIIGAQQFQTIVFTMFSVHGS